MCGVCVCGAHTCMWVLLRAESSEESIRHLTLLFSAVRLSLGLPLNTGLDGSQQVPEIFLSPFLYSTEVT